MDKEQLMRFINILTERRESSVLVFRQLAEILKEQNAPREYVDLVEIMDNAYSFVHKTYQEKHKLTESDLRAADREYRKQLAERAGRC